MIEKPGAIPHQGTDKFGPKFSNWLRRSHCGYGDTFYVDEVFIKIQGKQYYLWRAVDQDSEVVDVLLQSRRDGHSRTDPRHVSIRK